MEKMDARSTSCGRSVTPPVRRRRMSPMSPPKAPRKAQPTPLMKAMLKGQGASLEEVLAAIGSEPDAPQLPLFDHGVEPPLNFAVRHGCSAEIIRALLAAGANPNGKDLQMRSPLMVVFDAAPKATELREAFSSWATKVARILMSAGADPFETDLNGRTAVKAAAESGCASLADAVECYLATQARAVLQQAKDTRGEIGSLGSDLLGCVMKFV